MGRILELLGPTLVTFWFHLAPWAPERVPRSLFYRCVIDCCSDLGCIFVPFQLEKSMPENSAKTHTTKHTKTTNKVTKTFERKRQTLISTHKYLCFRKVGLCSQASKHERTSTKQVRKHTANRYNKNIKNHKQI